MLTSVTVTGADDSVKPIDLIQIARDFPYVEFGILLGNHFNESRFPSAGWLHHLYMTAMKGCGQCLPAHLLRLSAHLCGSLVPEFLSGTARLLPLVFGRMQVNTYGIRHSHDPLHLRRNVLRANHSGIQVIFQYDQVNAESLSDCRDGSPGNFCSGLSIAALFDLSHGMGVLPEVWPESLPGIPCGYAGGLSPENVAEELPKIAEAAGKGTPFWIDVETGVRSPDGSRFDLDRVVRFLEATKPYIYSESLDAVGKT